MRNPHGIAFIALLSAAWVMLAAPEARGQWVQTDGPYGSSDIQSLAINGPNLFAGTYGGGVFLSTDNGSNWIGVNTGMTRDIVYALAVSDSNLIAGTLDKGVFLSTDNGTIWTTASNALTGAYVSAIAVSGTNVFAGTYGGGVFLLTDTGWKAVNTGLTTNLVWSLAVNGTSLFAGTVYGGIFLSTDKGINWEAVNNGLTDDSVTSVLALAASPSTLFAGIFNVATYISGVFLSSDNGTNWVAANNGLPNTFPFTVRALTVVGTNVFAGTNFGVFLSTNDGGSWTAVGSGMTNYNVNALVADSTYLFAGTDSCVYRRPLSEMIGSSVVEPALSPTYTLSTYPNPFTQSTTITFTSPERGAATVAIVNILGTEVAQLYEGELSAGEHSFTWDAGKDACTTGVYECIVQMNGHVERTPIILSR